ncbi:TPA: metallophosphoesterase [Candidatus Geothermarchaeota archaeon]|nr:metallophosphoesterase [Candidatus Geothermarchaeota archaeon]HIQ13446.1 metallophosphoesterase [Thermoprotei archaeon]
MKIKLDKSLYIASPWPAAYIEDANILVMSDLHLGIEGYLEDEGIFLPRGVSRSTAEIVFRAIEDYRPEMVVFNGDLKHSFGLLKSSEWRELTEFFRRLKEEYNLLVHVVRGNHDNYLSVILDKFGFKMVDRYDVGDITIIHGHKEESIDKFNEIIVIGHEHPSIVIRDEAGGKYRFKCFLWGDIGGKKILVLPPVSEISSGTSFNNYELVEPLSPLLKDVDLGGFKPYAIVPGQIVRELPTLEILKDLL